MAHILLPDLPAPGPATKNDRHFTPPKPDLQESARSALRSLVIVFPLTFILLCLNISISYTVIMIKIATMGHSCLGGYAHLPLTDHITLAVTMAGLLYGPRIFRGAGMHKATLKN